jgi:uncharacterized protein
MDQSKRPVFKLRQLPGRLAIVRLDPTASVPDWASQGAIVATVRSSGELSVVCDESVVPEGCCAERGWIALQLEGPFPFTMTGVLASFLGPLGAAGVPVFVLSTFDTDVVMVKGEQAERAIEVLEREGHRYLGIGT